MADFGKNEKRYRFILNSYTDARFTHCPKCEGKMGQRKLPLVIHQPSYSILNRWVEKELLSVLEQEGVGCIAFSPLAQGLLSNKYLNGVPDDSRAAQGRFSDRRW